MQKTRLHEYCQSLVQQKLTSVEEALQAARGAAHQETKSSAGDKYETGRAMMHLEQEKLARQRSEALKLKKVLDQINPRRVSEQIALGSLVTTSRGIFYVAVSLGSVAFEEASCFVISPVAPLGQVLQGLRVGDTFPFGGATETVDRIE